MATTENPSPSDQTSRSGGDRRQSPRREAERNLHYAEVNLLAAAVAAADQLVTIEHDLLLDDPLARLVAAARVYGGASIEAGR